MHRFSILYPSFLTSSNTLMIILGKGNLIFCCTDSTDPNFREIKITITLISHKYFCFYNLFSSGMIFFFSVTIKQIKTKI